jgi:hypothetical protein
MSASAAADERAAQLVSAASDNRMHLTGDMIRKLREQHNAKQNSHHDRVRMEDSETSRTIKKAVAWHNVFNQVCSVNRGHLCDVRPFDFDRRSERKKLDRFT